jgi:hypothetical protein
MSHMNKRFVHLGGGGAWQSIGNYGQIVFLAIYSTCRCGARLYGSKSNAINLILSLFVYHFFTYNELVMSRVNPQQHKQPTNTTTMVVEPLTPPAAWIQ